MNDFCDKSLLITAKKVTFHVLLRLRKCAGNSTLQSKCQAIFMKFGSVMYDFIHISDTGNSNFILVYVVSKICLDFRGLHEKQTLPNLQ